MGLSLSLDVFMISGEKERERADANIEWGKTRGVCFSLRDYYWFIGLGNILENILAMTIDA